MRDSPSTPRSSPPPLSKVRGFLTFLIGTPFSLRLGGPYWDDAIDLRLDWMNCAAVRPTSPMLPYLWSFCRWVDFRKSFSAVPV